jgi:hypothetical protein
VCSRPLRRCFALRRIGNLQNGRRCASAGPLAVDTSAHDRMLGGANSVGKVEPRRPTSASAATGCALAWSPRQCRSGSRREHSAGAPQQQAYLACALSGGGNSARNSDTR